MAHTDSRAYYQKPIVHPRGSSNDSNASYYSQSSTDYYSSGRSNMTDGYSGASYNYPVQERVHRTSDDKHKQVKSTSRDGRTVIQQNSARVSRDEPLASDARHEDYRQSQSRDDRKKRKSQKK